ncbi:MAG: hypothetical protein AAFQ94_23720 [Bacteroidota bacterium]
MKKIGLVLITFFIIIYVCFFFEYSLEWAALGIILYVPILFILASVGFFKSKKAFKGKGLVLALSLLSILSLFGWDIMSKINDKFLDYDYWFYGLALIMLLLASVIILYNNSLKTLTDNAISIEIILLLIPVAAFFAVTHLISSDFVHKKHIASIGLVANEMDHNNRLLNTQLNEINELQSIYYNEIILLIRDLDYQSKLHSGGYYEGWVDVKLIKPENTDGPNRALREGDAISKIREALNDLEEQEADKLIRSEIQSLRKEVFGELVWNNTVVEMQLRCAIAINRLQLLENYQLRKRLDGESDG